MWKAQEVKRCQFESITWPRMSANCIKSAPTENPFKTRPIEYEHEKQSDFMCNWACGHHKSLSGNSVSSKVLRVKRRMIFMSHPSPDHLTNGFPSHSIRNKKLEGNWTIKKLCLIKKASFCSWYLITLNQQSDKVLIFVEKERKIAQGHKRIPDN